MIQNLLEIIFGHYISEYFHQYTLKFRRHNRFSPNATGLLVDIFNLLCILKSFWAS